MNAEQVKEYIKEDIERIEKVLESAGCHRIWRSGSEVRCASPFGDNHTAISVNVDTLYCRYFKEGETFRGNLISLIQYLRNEGFSSTFRFIKSIFGLGGKFVKEEKVDPLATFKKLRKATKIVTDIREREIPKFGLETLDEFVMLPHISLFYEGIMPQTAELFKIGYDPKLDRIIFPHFSYEDINAIVGITGRTTRSKEEIKELLIPKYYNYIKGYMKTWNLYGFSHSLPYIKKNKMLIISEAEKSVLKHFTMTRNEGFSASTGGHELSQEQVQIILQNTPPDTEIVIAYDKDVMTMTDDDGKPIGEEFLVNTCKKISKYRKTSYIWDAYDILGEKDAPIDRGYKIFHYLLKYRKTV
jgi:DNA primase